MSNTKHSLPIAAPLLVICALSKLLMPLLDRTAKLSALSLLPIASIIFLCVALFKKDRGNLLILALVCSAIVSFVQLITSKFSISSLISFLASVMLVTLALANCKQTFLNLDFSKTKTLINKLFFIPALLSLITLVLGKVALWRVKFIFSCLIDWRVGVPFLRQLVPFLFSVLYAVAILMLAAWLKDPSIKKSSIPAEERSAGETTTEYDESYCSLGKHILLCLFTFGIWYLIWTYRTTKYLNKAPNFVWYNPTSKLLLCIFVPFYQIYWFYKHGQRIDALSKEKKLSTSDMATLCLILGIFIPIVACILMQDKINTLCLTNNIVDEKKAEDSVSDDLKKYKELFDQGVITEEEFTAKKKQLLNL